MVESFFPLFLQMVEAMLLAGSLLLAAKYLGPSRPNFIKQRVYESGMDAVGSAHERHSVSFYLVAMIFIVFDVEVVFLYPWAVTFHEFIDAGVGLQVLGIVFVFIVILAIGLLYDIKKGGLVFDETSKPVNVNKSIQRKPIVPGRAGAPSATVADVA